MRKKKTAREVSEEVPKGFLSCQGESVPSSVSQILRDAIHEQRKAHQSVLNIPHQPRSMTLFEMIRAPMTPRKNSRDPVFSRERSPFSAYAIVRDALRQQREDPPPDISSGIRNLMDMCFGFSGGHRDPKAPPSPIDRLLAQANMDVILGDVPDDRKDNS